ncbi:MAG: FISUMP domain-containing protein, partial [Flavobacteriales bacterium]
RESIVHDMRKFFVAILAIWSIQFGANAQSPLLGDTVILKAQVSGDVVQITLDDDALRDTLTALGVIEGRTIGVGVASLLALWDSVQTVSASLPAPDLTPPTMTITASEVSDGASSSDPSLSLTFTSSESTTDFAEADITVTNGALSGFAGSGTTYTATFTPTADGACTINVAGSTFTDAAANNNTAADEFNWTYDATAPTMTITASEVSDGASSSDASLSLTFTSSESTTDFAEADITVTNGALSGFAGSGTTYTATFTPTADGACTINVAGSTFTDAAGIDNTAADEFNWTYVAPAVFTTCGDAIGYDGYNYATVQIGGQCWFAENLRNANYNDGSAIPSGLGSTDWSSTTDGRVTVYDEGGANEASNLADYGRLYNWYAVETGNLCPSGWHVPTDAEWTTLTDGFGGESTAGNALKSASSDSPAWDGTNSSGFSALAGGDRSSNGSFNVVGNYGYFWSASPNGALAWNRLLLSGYTGVSRNYNNRRNGFSVRCVLD